MNSLNTTARSRARLLAAATFFIAASAIAAAEAKPAPRVYYVDGDGGDGGTGGDNQDGTSTATAWLTLNRAFDTTKPTHVRGGDTLRIRGGVYQECLHDVIPSGTAAAPTTITNHGAEIVTIKQVDRPRDAVFNIGRTAGNDRSYINIEGNDPVTKRLIIDANARNPNGIRLGIYRSGLVVRADHIVMRNLEVKNGRGGSGGGALIAIGEGSEHNLIDHCSVHDMAAVVGDRHYHCLYISGSHNTISHCDIYNGSHHGIHVYGHVPGFASYNVIKYNRIHDNDVSGGAGPGIGTYGAGNIIHNNLIWNNARGIFDSLGASGTRIFNNTIYNNHHSPSKGSAGIWLHTSSSGAIVRNNLCHGDPEFNYRDQGRGAATDHNATGATDPKFASTDPADPSFLKLSADSPTSIRDAGASLGSPYDHDFWGTTRPQGSAYDIGAHEYAPGSSPRASARSTRATRGETRKAADLSPEAVAASINAAHDGDTVELPAGKAEWTKGWNTGRGTRMKAITIKGAGIDKTVIVDRRPKAVAGDALFAFNGEPGKPFRLTGLTIDGTGRTIAGQGFMIELTGDCDGFRIDHCKFKNAAGMIHFMGDERGLVDHCKFEATESESGLVQPIKHNGPGLTNYSKPLRLGSAEALYFEDNEVPFSPEVVDPTGNNPWIASYGAARTVIRHNTIVNSQLEHVGPKSGALPGSQSVEIYNNVFLAVGLRPYRPQGFIFIAAGAAMVFNNTVTGPTFNSRAIRLRNVRALLDRPGLPKGDGHNPIDGNRIPDGQPGAGYPHQGQVGWATNVDGTFVLTPCHAWDNTLNGKPLRMEVDTRAEAGELATLKEGREFFNTRPPAGSYTPYVYPHPLQKLASN